jgi:hypothetical protein
VSYSPAAHALALFLAAASEPDPPGSVQHVEVALPPEWRMGAHVVLLLEDVTTPRGVAFKVQVSARAEREPDVLLGGFGVLADAPGAEGSRAPMSYRVDVTRGLRRWGELHPAAKTVTLALATVDGRSKPIAVSWRVGRALLRVRPDSPATTGPAPPDTALYAFGAPHRRCRS